MKWTWLRIANEPLQLHDGPEDIVANLGVGKF